MGALSGVPVLLAAAEASMRRTSDRVGELQTLFEENNGQTAFVDDLQIATAEIEVAVVGVFSLFEARMQSCLPQGSFFKHLTEGLKAVEQVLLAERVHQYYLAVNVLKHGRGSSYESLRAIPDLPFSVRQPESDYFEEGDVAEPEGLVDLLADGFCDGLIDTLRQVNLHLENRHDWNV